MSEIQQLGLDAPFVIAKVDTARLQLVVLTHRCLALTDAMIDIADPTHLDGLHGERVELLASLREHGVLTGPLDHTRSLPWTCENGSWSPYLGGRATRSDPRIVLAGLDGTSLRVASRYAALRRSEQGKRAVVRAIKESQPCS